MARKIAEPSRWVNKHWHHILLLRPCAWICALGSSAVGHASCLDLVYATARGKAALAWLASGRTAWAVPSLMPGATLTLAHLLADPGQPSWRRRNPSSSWRNRDIPCRVEARRRLALPALEDRAASACRLGITLEHVAHTVKESCVVRRLYDRAQACRGPNAVVLGSNSGGLGTAASRARCRPGVQ